MPGQIVSRARVVAGNGIGLAVAVGEGEGVVPLRDVHERVPAQLVQRRSELPETAPGGLIRHGDDAREFRARLARPAHQVVALTAGDEGGLIRQFPQP